MKSPTPIRSRTPKAPTASHAAPTSSGSHRPDTYIPEIEDRLLAIERTGALWLMLTRAAGAGGDLGLSEADNASAWSGLGELAVDLLQQLRAVRAALPSGTLGVASPLVASDGDLEAQ